MQDSPSSSFSAYPLAGITVLDLGQIYQGPYCGFLLAMAGARVIKIEPPKGEPIRSRRGVSVPLAMLNSNKEGITLDLKSNEGRDAFLRLVDRADVVIENFLPGVMDRLGVGGKLLLGRNPRLIFASASGYGSSGPYRDLLAMDLTIQAMSGMINATGFPDQSPVKAGPSICDFLGGAHLYGAVITALFERSRTGAGRICEVAMLDAAYIALTSTIGLHFDDPTANPRTGSRHAGMAMAPYNVYPSADGYVAIICVNEEHWHGVARAMGRADLIGDSRFATHAARCAIMEEIDTMVGAWTGKLTRDRLMDASKVHRFPAAPVRKTAEVVQDPHLHARGMLIDFDHPELGPVVLPNSPMRFDGLPPMPLRASPSLGQDNTRILKTHAAMPLEQA
ncbi:L-carnitine dehydratase/bile acid-inducible protein F [Verminephrobacter eiseniae EF01-2]|uniref:L-carnitine dehydratase/bile acid-inducible protein F n=1 Tax=Verminephrobacter eiseniae (strain EF01-2) TaxID=391735 RepID=A1WF09_VEREI|nr:CoA transferase [Verminephrobacter eiseniae]ABM56216.1 L-carnitine dehydratase/bile acid-inducible protein F [Verminephrobacter eiseniae EF01-2]